MNKSMKEIKVELLENEICSAVGSKLAAIYPGWQWWVDVNAFSGMCDIRCITLSNKFGVGVKLVDLEKDVHLRSVMNAGGELLERFGFPRGKRPERINVDRDPLTGEALGGDLHGAA